jgi:hypothetical protein
MLSGAIYLPWRLHAAPDPLPSHALPTAEAGGVVVGLCDGKTSIEVPWLKPGRRITGEQAREVSRALMAKWREQQPDAKWQMAQAQTTPRQGQAAAPAAPQVGQGGVYEGLTPREQMIADVETAKFIEEAWKFSHNSDKLGGMIGVSCDMCHPDAANTHPETYPKFHTKLQRVALLRDMINW